MKKEFFFKASRFPFFYGWVILAATIIGMIMSIPGQTLGVSVFTEDLKKILHFSSTGISVCFFMGTVASGFLITYAGKMFDIYGARIIAVTASLFMGLFLIYMSNINAIRNFFLAHLHFLKPSAVTYLFASFGFLGLRFFGLGVLIMTSLNMAMKWFERNRGYANAFVTMFTILIFNYSPQYLHRLLIQKGWAGTWLSLAIVIGVLFPLFVLLFYRDNPFKFGCLPDNGGESGNKRRKRHSVNIIIQEMDLSEARSTFAFWAFNLAFALNALIMTGFTFHVEDIFSSAGFSSEKAFSIFWPSAIVSFFISIIANYISDYIRLRYLLFVYGAGLLSGSFSIFLLGKESYAVWFFIFGNGVSTAMYFVLNAVTWPRYFGINHLGAISGYSMSWMIVASGLGPLLFAFCKRIWNHYDVISIVGISLSLLLIIVSFKASSHNEDVFLSKTRKKEIP